MEVTRRRSFALYVDRSSQQWIVLDGDGQFWAVSASEEAAWDQRQPFCPTDETELEPIPAHISTCSVCQRSEGQVRSCPPNKFASTRPARKKLRGKSGAPI